MAYQFLVRLKEDHVGVAVEEIRAGETVQGFYLDDDSSVEVRAVRDIPLGHKISLIALTEGSPVKKYGEPIGTASVAIQAGEHVHIHNLRSERQT